MQGLSKWKKEIQEFWELETSDRDKLIGEIAAYASTSDPIHLAREVRANYAQEVDSGISVLYEALTHQPIKWTPFFVQEFERAFRAAETASDPKKILSALDEIAMADENYTALSDALILVIANYASSRIFEIRYKVVWFLGDYLRSEITNRQSDGIAVLRVMLHDENWKIRVLAAQTLKGIDQLPKKFSLSILDRLRHRFLQIG